jgi:hypothetical protein
MYVRITMFLSFVCHRTENRVIHLSTLDPKLISFVFDHKEKKREGGEERMYDFVTDVYVLSFFCK